MVVSESLLIDIASVASITVTYHPDIAVVERQLQALGSCGHRIVVDNGSPNEYRLALRALVSRMPGTSLLELVDNLGLAAGLNAGINAIGGADVEIHAILLLDQDSEFTATAPLELVEALNSAQSISGTMCCVGPVMTDPAAGMAHGFHYVAHGWRWARAYPPSSSRELFPVANLNGSGTLMPTRMVAAVGPLDATLFIDHVDTEWSFRVLSRGYSLYGVPWVQFQHRMGEAGRRIWLLGWRVWPERSPLRHYFLYRNTVRLMRRNYVPRVWKAWAAMKMMVTVCVTICIDSRRLEQVRMMSKGVREAMSESVA